MFHPQIQSSAHNVRQVTRKHISLIPTVMPSFDTPVTKFPEHESESHFHLTLWLCNLNAFTWAEIVSQCMWDMVIDDLYIV